ncbi:AraC family transcriptional regulator [Phytohabitans flavus]|uniref:AraC family transcriptional regulator n=1 Tax=Phytohabitans flavus TaxID=1076124 RepID=UPI0039E97369
MSDVIEKAVHRAIERMHENLAAPLTVEEMARTAMFSKFHFTRIFQRVTGCHLDASCPRCASSGPRSFSSPPR